MHLPPRRLRPGWFVWCCLILFCTSFPQLSAADDRKHVYLKQHRPSYIIAYFNDVGSRQNADNLELKFQVSGTARDTKSPREARC